MKISKRLKAISDLVEDNSNVIDVGCDHALLDIYLFNNKKNIKLIASDVKEGPLEQAKKNIEKYGCKIKVKLGYGISTIESNIDTIVIAGMGGDTIIDIINNGNDKLDNVKSIITSPQSEWKKVRKKICSLGFCIKEEKIIEENNKFYLIIKFVKGYKRYSSKELEFGPILLKKKANEFIKYYKQMLQERKSVLAKIPKFKIYYRVKEIKKIIILKNILK